MIEILIVICISSLVFVSSYNILSLVIGVTESKAVKLLTAMKPNNHKSLWNKYLILMQRLIVPYIYIDAKKEKNLMRELYKAKWDISPKQHIANLWITGLNWTVIVILTWIFGLHIFSIGFVLIGLASTFNKKNELTETIIAIDADIEAELPQFIRSFGQSLEGQKDIITILEKYLQICGPAFRNDIAVLITDLKTGNQDEAFLKFDERLNIPLITSFISGVIGTAKGIDQKTFFYILERDVQNLANENLKRMLADRPAKINWASMAVFSCFMLMIIYPVVMIIIENTKILR